MLTFPDKAGPTGKQGRGGNAAACAVCGAVLRPKPGARGQQYCGSTCRKAANRALKFGSRYPHSGLSRSVQNSPTKSVACEGGFGDLGSRICGPEHVVKAELGTSRNWREVISPDGVRCLVTRWRGGPAL